MTVSYAIVVPTLGRPSLERLVASLDVALAGAQVLPAQVVLVHDGAAHAPSLALGAPTETLARRIVVVPGEGRGPAAARNAGWRVVDGSTEWIAFLDDDVVVPPTWAAELLADLDGLDDDVGGSQGKLRVPLPRHRRPTDWERNVAALEHAAWATADMAYRRTALETVGGFDTRFSRAYREDADLALRVEEAGWKLVRGTRWTEHPVRPAGRCISVPLQRGNADDVLMRALHGPDWRARAAAPAGRRRRHLAVT
ncbi:MAG: glycosyltransferase, partial [Actinomycetota bacterium]|nr:glycosyltransferase [Actinomycetota bacterium]